MTNICRCGTYQRIREAVHLAAGNGPRRHAGRGNADRCGEISHDKDDPRHREFRAASSSSARPPSRAADWRSASTCRSARAQAQNAPASEVNIWVVDQARRHLRDPHRALGDGAGHAHRPRPARRRGARVRLEARSRPKASSPGQNLARKRAWGDMSTGGSRGIRGSQDYVRRGGAAARMMLLQAAADQWKVPVGELTVSNGVITHAASQALDQLRQGRRGGGQADAARSEERSSSRIRRTGRSPASR